MATVATGSPALDQVAALISALVGTASVAMPERRRDDVHTLSHRRAAEHVHSVAGWLLRGSDLRVVTQKTPFLARDTAELWQYYESLPMDQRLDRLISFVLFVELLETSKTLPRSKFPILRRVIDVYTAALAAACVIPRRLFFHVHRIYWSMETASARRNLREPETPMPQVGECCEAACRTIDSTCVSLGLPSPAAALFGTSLPSAFSGGNNRTQGTSWTTSLLIVSGLGFGAYAWLRGVDKLKGDARRARDGIDVVFNNPGAALDTLLGRAPGPRIQN